MMTTKADLVIMLNTVTYGLRQNPDGTYTVIETTSTTSSNARAMVGRTFKRGDDPWAWPQGYACRIQQAINQGDSNG